MINGQDVLTIKDYLERKGIINITNEVTKMDERKQGRRFSFAEHIRGMVYALLSAQTKWENIERNISNIDSLFDNFSPKFIKSHDYMYFYDGLGRWGARGRLTKGQLKELHYNISVMENIILEYGSMDRFVEAHPIHELIDKLSNPKSEYKIKMMGEALVCEYLRNVGVDCFKPDVHLKRMLGKERLCVINKIEPDFADLYFAMTKLKEETGLWMAQIDYILWAYCASGFGEVCSATPNCKCCVVRDNCVYK